MLVIIFSEFYKMKKLFLILIIIFTAGIINSQNKFYNTFSANGINYQCELIYENSDLIPCYTLNIRSYKSSANERKKATLLIKKQEYNHNLKTNIETWERFLKRRSSKRISKEITFHIVDGNKYYATFVFQRGSLIEHYFNNELCLVKDREKRVYIYPNESILFAVVRQFLKGTRCLPNEKVLTELN